MSKFTVLVIALTMLMAFALVVVTAAPAVPYKSGDYTVYRFIAKYESGGQVCSVEATFRVEITKVDYPYVSYTGRAVDTKANALQMH